MDDAILKGTYIFFMPLVHVLLIIVMSTQLWEFGEVNWIPPFFVVVVVPFAPCPLFCDADTRKVGFFVVRKICKHRTHTHFPGAAARSAGKELNREQKPRNSASVYEFVYPIRFGAGLRQNCVKTCVLFEVCMFALYYD